MGIFDFFLPEHIREEKRTKKLLYGSQLFIETALRADYGDNADFFLAFYLYCVEEKIDSDFHSKNKHELLEIANRLRSRRGFRTIYPLLGVALVAHYVEAFAYTSPPATMVTAMCDTMFYNISQRPSVDIFLMQREHKMTIQKIDIIDAFYSDASILKPKPEDQKLSDELFSLLNETSPKAKNYEPL